MRVRSFLLLFSQLLSLVSPQAISAVDSKAIMSRADQFLLGHVSELEGFYDDTVRIEYQINPIDSRLSMADCPVALDAKLKSQNTTGNINLKVSCKEGRPWSLYVQAKISLFRTVVTTITPIARGTVINAGHLDIREVDTSKLNGSYFMSFDEVINMQANRNIRADSVVISNHLSLPIVIKKGDAVLMTAQTKGLLVKIPGTAMTDGRKGQQISVRNNQSKRVVDARVSGPGQVIINM